MLRAWIQSGENAAEVESFLILQRKSLHRTQANEELLTLAEMFERKIPVEKIRAVVSRGGGIADPDAPGVAKLTKYWIETSRTRMNREDSSQTAELRVAANAQSTMDAMALETPQLAASQPSDMQALMDQAQSAVAPTSTPAAG